MNINPMDLLKNFSGMQEKIGEMQSKLADITVTGYAGGDMVKVVLNGHMDVLDIRITKEAIEPDAPEGSMTEELVKAAFNDAVSKVREKINEEISSMTGGVIPPGGFPFGSLGGLGNGFPK